MNLPLEQHREDIRKELEQLGFDAVEATLGKAEECQDLRDSSVKSIIMENLSIDDHCVGDIYIFINERDGRRWHIEQIIASVQLETERCLEGIVVCSEKYHICDGPLPQVDQVRYRLQELVKEERAKEAIFLRYDLEKEFKQLGFDNYFEMLRSARNVAGFKVLETEVELGIPGIPSAEWAKFEFFIQSPEEGFPAIIWMVRGSLVEKGIERPMIAYQAERGFYRFNDAIPDKHKMIGELLTIAKFNPDPYEAVRKRFRIGEAQAESDRQKGYFQGKLNL